MDVGCFYAPSLWTPPMPSLVRQFLRTNAFSELTPLLPPRFGLGGLDSLANSFFSTFLIPLLAGKSKTDTSIQNTTFIMVSGETVWGKMSVMTVGSFQVFIKRVTLTRVLHVKVNVFPNTLIFMFSV